MGASMSKDLLSGRYTFVLEFNGGSIRQPFSDGLCCRCKGDLMVREEGRIDVDVALEFIQAQYAFHFLRTKPKDESQHEARDISDSRSQFEIERVMACLGTDVKEMEFGTL